MCVDGRVCNIHEERQQRRMTVSSDSSSGDGATKAPSAAYAPSEDDTPRAERAWWVRALERASVYFAIYVLSLGPMYWHWWEGKYMSGSRLVAAFYEPLLLLSGWIPPLGWFINAYVHIWVMDLKWTL